MGGNEKTENACCREQERTDIPCTGETSESLQARANTFSIKSVLVPMRKRSHGPFPWSAKLLFCWKVAFAFAMPVTYTAAGKESEGGMQFWLSAWSWGLL